MLVSDGLTVGQLTFIVRVCVQILTYGGLFVLSMIVLATAQRVASLPTHDVLNRIVGKGTSTQHSIKWIFASMRGQSREPVRPARLMITIFLFTVYSTLVAVADIGFLGFHSCSVPLPSSHERPHSISDPILARAAIQDVLTNGTEPGHVDAFRCDSTEVIHFGPNVTFSSCTSWRNSTLDDHELFMGINSTDSDSLVPRFVRPRTYASGFKSTGYTVDVGIRRITHATMTAGMAVQPHETGVTALFGVPDLRSEEKVTIPKTLSLEGEIGCLRLGMFAQHNLDVEAVASQELFALEWNQTFFGPEYMRPTLIKYGERLRSYYRGHFNESDPKTLQEGFLSSYDDIGSISSPSSMAQVQGLTYATIGNTTNAILAGLELFGNCTMDLHRELGLRHDREADAFLNPTCKMMAVTGTSIVTGFLYAQLIKYICATTEQVNMVSATVEKDIDGTVSMNVTRLPSDLHVLRADFYEPRQDGEDTIWISHTPYMRYTLSDNPNGTTSHYTLPQGVPGHFRASGPANAGIALSRLASTMLVNANGDPAENEPLAYLDEGFDPLNNTIDKITRWAGQVGASMLVQSLAYNGWVAAESTPLLVSSTGGKPATCYTPAFALGFLPLVLTTIIVVLWACFTLVSGAFGLARRLEGLYGGLAPLRPVVYPHSQILMAWQKTPEPHLDLVPPGHPMTFDPDATAAAYLNSTVVETIKAYR